MKFFAYCLLLLSLLFVNGGDILASETTSPVPSVSANVMERLNPEEKRWFETFFTGNMLFRGWNDITKEILEKTPPELRESQKARLDRLGVKIGLEWCRANSVRRVDNSMLRQWGKRLKQVVKENPEQLPEIIVSIDQEVDNILN